MQDFGAFYPGPAILMNGARKISYFHTIMERYLISVYNLKWVEIQPVQVYRTEKWKHKVVTLAVRRPADTDKSGMYCNKWTDIKDKKGKNVFQIETETRLVKARRLLFTIYWWFKTQWLIKISKTAAGKNFWNYKTV